MGTKVAVIALQHHLHPNLFLFGRRKNGNWCLPGGHFEPNESALDAARRELYEETGLRLFPIFQKKKTYLVDGKDLTVFLYKSSYSGIPVTNENDPDAEFVSFKFLDPYRTDIAWEVPKERNILLS